MATSPVLEAINEIGSTFEAFKKSQDQRLSEVTDRLEQLEAGADRPKGTIGERTESTGELRVEALGYLAKGLALQDQKLIGQAEEMLTKTVSGASAGAGANTVQEQIGDEIFREVRKATRILDLVRVTEIETAPGSFKRVVSTTGTNSGWVGELGTRTATSTPVFNVATPTGGMLYSYPAMSEEIAASSAFQIGEFLLSEIVEDFAAQLGEAVVSGDGTNKPTGFLDTAPVSTGDDDSPARAFGVLQYIATGAAAGFQGDYRDSPPGDPFAVFWNTIAALRSQYRRDAVWLLNSNTLAAIGKLRDADGRSLIVPNPTAGAAPTLLGYAVEVEEAMPDLGSNAHPILFGDLRRAYEIVSNFTMRLTRDEVTTPGLIKLYARSYLGGTPTNTQAAKAVKCASS